MSTAHPVRSPYTDIPFIHLLRAIAVLMVLYDHLIGAYTIDRNIQWMPRILIDTYVLAPFGIIQSLGFMGVTLFFLVSGYIITHVASSENRVEFLIKRVCRIYPPLIISILVALLFSRWIGLQVPELKSILLNFTLLNYLQVPQVVIQGVAWSLLIEVEFYLITVIFLSSLKRWPAFHVILQSLLVAACIFVCKSFGDEFFLFSAGFTYIPYLLVGQLFYYHQRNRLPTGLFLALVCVQFALIQWGIRSIHTQFLPVGNSYLINFVFSFVLFSVMAKSSLNNIKGLPKRVAEMSYSLYLLHGIIGIGMLNMLTPHLAYPLALVIALSMSLGAAYLSFLYIEKPSQKLARRLLANLKPPAVQKSADGVRE